MGQSLSDDKNLFHGANSTKVKTYELSIHSSVKTYERWPENICRKCSQIVTQKNKESLHLISQTSSKTSTPVREACGKPWSDSWNWACFATREWWWKVTSTEKCPCLYYSKKRSSKTKRYLLIGKKCWKNILCHVCINMSHTVSCLLTTL